MHALRHPRPRVAGLATVLLRVVEFELRESVPQVGCQECVSGVHARSACPEGTPQASVPPPIEVCSTRACPECSQISAISPVLAPRARTMQVTASQVFQDKLTALCQEAGDVAACKTRASPLLFCRLLTRLAPGQGLRE